MMGKVCINANKTHLFVFSNVCDMSKHNKLTTCTFESMYSDVCMVMYYAWLGMYGYVCVYVSLLMYVCIYVHVCVSV